MKLKNKKFPSCGPKGAKSLIRDSNYTLGERLYLQGKFKFDLKLGTSICHLDLGHFLSGYMLNIIIQMPMIFMELKNAKAIKYLKLSADYNFLPPLVSLRDIYLNGDGVEKDFIKAKFYHSRALKIANKKILKLGSQFDGMQVLINKLSKNLRTYKFRDILNSYKRGDKKSGE